MNDSIRFILNGEDVALRRQAYRDASRFPRLKRRLTGTKEGCAEGDCGACTVLVGRLIDGKLHYESGQCLHPLHRLAERHPCRHRRASGGDDLARRIRCSRRWSTVTARNAASAPRLVMSMYGLWLANSNPDRAEIEKALQGNLCRCTGYEPIVKAAEQVARTRSSALFDPLERTRSDIVARLWAMQGSGTISIASGEDRLLVPGSLKRWRAFWPTSRKATIVAGSTDVGLWVTKQMRTLNPVVFINHLQELQTITSGEGGITIGAGVTYTRALETIAGKVPTLGRLITRIGGEQVRNMGTIGGNIANGSPIGDSPPPLIALGATVKLRSTEGNAHAAAGGLFHRLRQAGPPPRRVCREPLRALPGRGHAFCRLQDHQAPRRGDITAVLGAFYLTLDEQGDVNDVRIAFGGMAGTPARPRRRKRTDRPAVE